MHFRDPQHEAAALRRMLDVARQLSRPFELAELLEQVIDAGRHVLNADRGSVFLLDAARKELYTVAATGVSEIRFSIENGIAGQCARNRQVINVPDCYADPRFNPAIDKQTGYRTNCMITIPLIGVDDELVGVMQLLNAADGGFSDEDEELAVLVASQAATAIQRVRLMEDRLERLKLERELDVARRIQMGVLPDALPTLNGYDIATYINPAEQTGGDIFDVVAMNAGADDEDAPAPLFIMLADATGHGVGPALSVTQVRAMLRVGLRLSASLDDLFLHINSQLAEDLSSDRFVTAFFGVLDPRTHAIAYHAAGQAPLLHYHAAERRCEFLDASTIPMGIMDDPPLEDAPPMKMQPGDMLVLITDGMYEHQNAAGEQMGKERVGEVVDAHRDAPAAKVMEALIEAMRAFAQGAPQLDDVTGIVVKRTG